MKVSGASGLWKRRCEISALSCQSASASASSNGSMSTSTSPASSSMFKLSLSILWILFPKELGSSRLNPEVRREVSKSERTTFFTDLSFLSISVLFLSSSMMGFSGLISIQSTHTLLSSNSKENPPPGQIQPPSLPSLREHEEGSGGMNI
ncbi:unnamed protein product, partial [Vitis vinifera]